MLCCFMFMLGQPSFQIAKKSIREYCEDIFMEKLCNKIFSHKNSKAALLPFLFMLEENM